MGRSHKSGLVSPPLFSRLSRSPLPHVWGVCLCLAAVLLAPTGLLLELWVRGLGGGGVVEGGDDN